MCVCTSISPGMAVYPVRSTTTAPSGMSVFFESIRWIRSFLTTTTAFWITLPLPLTNRPKRSTVIFSAPSVSRIPARNNTTPIITTTMVGRFVNLSLTLFAIRVFMITLLVWNNHIKALSPPNHPSFFYSPLSCPTESRFSLHRFDIIHTTEPQRRPVLIDGHLHDGLEILLSEHVPALIPGDVAGIFFR